MIRAGSLDRRITIEQSATSKGASGAPELTWSTFIGVWAEKISRGLAERILGRELVSETSTTWRIRYHEDVTPKMRISWDSRLFRIESVSEGRGRKAELFLVATEEVPARG